MDRKNFICRRKIIVIKYVSQAIPIYTMGCFKLPRALCQNINSMIRKFWWGSKKGERKANLVAWEKVVQPKYMGGMRFRDIQIFNLALLARQAWSLLTKPESLCSKILKAVYFPSRDLLSVPIGNEPSNTWRAIWEGIDVLKQG